MMRRAPCTVKVEALTMWGEPLTRAAPDAVFELKGEPHVWSAPTNFHYRPHPCAGGSARPRSRRGREVDAVAAQDLYPARRQDPRHDDPGVWQEDRGGGADPDLHLRRHVDEVHRGHRKQDAAGCGRARRSEEHTSELQSLRHLV